MKVMVTGGAGYIGCVTCAELKKLGHEVVAYDDMSNALKFVDEPAIGCLAGRVRLIQGSVLDVVALVDAFETFRPDVVLHLAAASRTGFDVSDQEFWDVNVAGSVNVGLAMKTCGVEKIVAASSSAVYKPTPGHELYENSKLGPSGGYGVSKLELEKCIWPYCSGLILMRYGNVAGATDFFGLSHESRTVVPMAVHAALTGSEFPMFGDDWPTEDGSCEIDLVHVSDIAKANVMALQRVMGFAGVMPLSVGMSSAVSIKEIVKIVEGDTGAKVNVVVKPRRSFDSPYVLNCKRAYDILGWMAQKMPGDTVKSQVDWERSMIDAAH